MAQSALRTDNRTFHAFEAAEIDLDQSGDVPLKMLIADDDPSVVKVLADRCLRMGFDVETATNGIQAALKATRYEPDVLVIDVNMPEIDGLSVCAHLLTPDRRPLNVVVVTGSRDPVVIKRCEGFGALYARKGADFWDEFEAALTNFYPELEPSIRQSGMRLMGDEVRRRPRVLLIDDDADVRDFLVGRLEQCGVDAVCAGDAMQGYRKACREEPTVIVSDYFMPNGDAQYLLTRLRTTYVTENIPVIVLSGRHLSEMTKFGLQREICGHRGAARILRKSADTSELFSALQQFCGFEREPDGGAQFRSQ
jgi:CheY-like chemotaxis protein